ncbi:hypothetical protein ACRRU2_17790 [Paenibacillus sp. GXUN7292]
MGNDWQAKREGTKRKIGKGEAAASAFVGQFYPLQGVISSKKLDHNSGRNPNLDRSGPFSIACCPIHN